MVDEQIMQEAGAKQLKNLFGLSRHFNHASILLSNNYPGSSGEMIAGFSNEAALRFTAHGNCFDTLQKLLDKKRGYYFGHFAYDLKNETENLFSGKKDSVGFPVMSFFEPALLLKQEGNELKRYAQNNDVADLFLKKTQEKSTASDQPIGPVALQQRTSRSEYVETANKILEHIHRGDIYEMNYCMEFFAEKVTIDPPALFQQLNASTGAPFSALYRDHNHWLLCASPERFLKKTGNKIISQPIKGTRRRGTTQEEDELLKQELLHDKKEQSENVMIVDIVRNDLSRSAAEGTVNVDELFGIYSFKTVHQLISTVSGELRNDLQPVDAIRNAFPMGSMTGAPKIKAMQLAEKYEQMRRGIYSGAVGYFTPEMDFDFNVVIRSIEYNADTGFLSLKVGSAITANADPAKEYEECLLKAKSLTEVLGHSL